MPNSSRFNILLILIFWKISLHSCFGMWWKSMDYNVKTVSTDFSGNIHRKCTIFSWPPFTKRDDYQPPPGPFNWSKTHSTGPGGFYYWIDAVAPLHHRAIHSPIWRTRQNWHACQIQTNGRNLTKLFAHFLDTQIQLGNQKDQKSQHGNLLKKRFPLRKCNEKGWRSTLSTFPRLDKP